MPSTIVTLTLKHRIPSWNEVLGMEQWTRMKLKEEIQCDFLCALRAFAADSSTKTTSAKNTLSIAAATLDSYRAMRLKQRALRSANKKLLAKKTSGQS